MLRQPFLALSALLSIGLITGCASGPPYSPEPFQSETIDAQAFVPKVDSFLVILDASSSMRDKSQESIKFYTAKDFVAGFNQTVPELDYQAGLVRFGGNPDESPPADLVYGLATYQRSGFASGLDSVSQASNITPMAEGINAASEALSGISGPVAVILVSDFWRLVNTADAVAAAEQLASQHANNLCLYVVKVGDYEKSDWAVEELAGISDCSKAMSVGDLASASVMGGFVKEALLKPAPQDKPIQYEKISFSAQALFDFDKAVLKQEGKAQLQKLGQHINSQGVKVVDINVIGHTDSKGSEEYNQKLSERRAMAVKDFLTSEGVNGSIIDASGEGESNPVADNSTDEGRALNRRVEVHVGAKQQMD
jgi:OOP family OmpA-OmpF porin